jgi:AcrR family transcriptional regulator
MGRAGTTLKSRETRERILRSAARLFVKEGFAHATMRRIAEDAGVALGLTYRYFPAKEDLALALYGELAVQLATAAEGWEPSSLADGFARAMRDKLALVAPHRNVLAALFAASLAGDAQSAPASVVGERSAAVRTQVRWVFRRVVERATDLPPQLDEAARLDLADALYGLHLALLLVWLVERTGGTGAPPAFERVGTGASGTGALPAFERVGAASALVEGARHLIARATPLAASPAGSALVREVARWLGSFLGDSVPPASKRRST